MSGRRSCWLREIPGQSPQGDVYGCSWGAATKEISEQKWARLCRPCEDGCYSGEQGRHWRLLSKGETSFAICHRCIPLGCCVDGLVFVGRVACGRQGRSRPQKAPASVQVRHNAGFDTGSGEDVRSRGPLVKSQLLSLGSLESLYQLLSLRFLTTELRSRAHSLRLLGSYKILVSGMLCKQHLHLNGWQWVLLCENNPGFNLLINGFVRVKNNPLISLVKQSCQSIFGWLQMSFLHFGDAKDRKGLPLPRMGMC